MDVRCINPFVEATKRVFSMMASTRILVHHPQAVACIRTGNDSVYAVVDMRGATQDGAVVLSFSTKVAMSIGASFMGTSVTIADASEAVGELANMVVGNARKDLKGRFDSISVPRVVLGDSPLGLICELSLWLRIAFSIPAGDFFLNVAFGDRT